MTNISSFQNENSIRLQIHEISERWTMEGRTYLVLVYEHDAESLVVDAEGDGEGVPSKPGDLVQLNRIHYNLGK